jgi:hypothetical protein
MPSPHARATAAEIQKQLQEALGHDQVKVKPHGPHYLIQMDADGELDTVARLTALTSHSYGAAFRSHTGRWDPLPDEGTREEMIQAVVDMLGPYLTPENY